jgi:hypothetical protein
MGLTQIGRPVGQYIYYGEIEKFDEYPSGTWIAFRDRSHDNKPVGVWVPSKLGPLTTRDELRNRMREKHSRLYALGTFEPKLNGTKYSIEIARLGRVWISLVGENQ